MKFRSNEQKKVDHKFMFFDVYKLYIPLNLIVHNIIKIVTLFIKNYLGYVYDS